MRKPRTEKPNTNYMKKYIISLIVALFAAVTFASAQVVVSEASKTEVSATAGFEGQYVFRGQKISNNIVTGTVTVALPTQTELSITGYQNTRDKDVDVNDEVDVTLSQGYSIDDVTTLTVGGSAYIYPGADKANEETEYTVEAFASIGYDAFLSPTATVGYDFYLKQTFVEGALSQDVKLPFLANNWKLVPSVAVGYATARDLLPEQAGRAVKDSYYYATGQIDLVYEVKNVVVAAGYRYNHLNNSAIDNNGWVGGSVTVRF